METIYDFLAVHAQSKTNDEAFTFIEDNGETFQISFSELHQKALSIAQYLKTQCDPGSRVVLLFPPGLEYIQSFLGCLYAGVVAVPLYPPQSKKHAGRVLTVIDDCKANLVLTNGVLKSQIEGELAPLSVLGFEQLCGEGAESLVALPKADDIAFLQYTSGSTGTPKGVVVSHGNIIANLKTLQQATRCSEDDVFCNWLPLFHDLGLVNTLLLPIFLGAHSVLMSPIRFIKNPITWLSAITEYKGTIGGAPNFAFDHCLERIKPHQMAGLDLSSWRIAFNAAEPLDADTLMRFCERFSRVGFKESAIFPAYGMAEATVFICGGTHASPYLANAFASDDLQQGRAKLCPIDQKQQVLIAHGHVQPEHHLKIVSPHTLTELPEGEVGEIWFAGPSLAQGYWNDEEKTNASFGAKLAHDDARYLRTGDLGFIHQGELYISGRIKDVMIIKGRNYYPQDFEKLAYQVCPGLNQNGAAAFEYDGNAVLLVEINRHEMKAFDYKLASETIKSAIFEQFEVVLADVVFLKAGRINRTSSGKIQRSLSKKRYLAQDLDALYRAIDGKMTDEASDSDIRLGAVTTLEAELCQLWQEVFGIDRIGVEDNFLSLGGHSLLATNLISQIQKKWHVDITMRDFFTNHTIRKLAKVIEAAQTSEVPAIMPQALQSAMPVSFAQERMWLVNQIESEQAQYNLPFSFKLYGELNTALLQQAFSSIIERHQALRTTYFESEGELYQRVQGATTFDLPVIDLTELAPEQQEQRVAKLRLAEANTAFNLAQDTMLRAALIKLNSQAHVLLITTHHIATDGWSLGVLTQELNALYGAYVQGADNPLSPLAIQYSDYAHWQRTQLKGDGLDKHLDYWTEHLAELPVVHSLALDKPRPAVQSFKGASVFQRLSPVLQDTLHQLAQKHDATLFMLMNAAFASFLGRYSGETDIVIGSPVANREQSELTPLIGLFMNNLVFRSDLSADPTFVELLAQSKERTLRAQAHQQAPFAKLVDALQPERDLSHSPLFQVMLILNNQHVEPLKLAGVDAKQIHSATSFAQYDLTLVLHEREDGLDIEWQYASELFVHETIERMAHHFEVILTSIVQAPDTQISQLPLLNADDAMKVTREWNATQLEFANDSCLHHMFEQQVIATPHAIAATYQGEQLSYEQLNLRANQLAHYLVQQGVTPDSIVGVCVDRSLEMLIATLAIMKSGGAYLPMDPTYPTARLAHMVADSGVKYVITTTAYQQTLSVEHLLCIDSASLQSVLAQQACLDLPTEQLGLTASNLAYVIYTSGSTGKPKGVMVEHRNAVNFISSMQKAPGCSAEDTLLAVTSLSFDIHVLELYLPLACGGEVVIAPTEALASPDELATLLETHEVTTMQATPATWKMLVQNGWQPLRPLKALCGGEALSVELKDALVSMSHIMLWNMYGPTETTVWSTTGEVNDSISLGTPIANTQCYVLDRHLQPVPVGCFGELYIGGEGVSRGYLNQAELTAERFVVDPFSRKPDGRLYKTGDLVRWLADGTLEYMRRADLQVKVRGHRIELEEIESVLKQHPNVVDAIAHVFFEGDSTHLVAYVIPKTVDGHGDVAQDLSAYLEECLPSYMVPAAIVELSELPLTPNGKVDRQALPAPQFSDPEVYVAPQSDTEQQLSLMWQALLDIDAQDISVTSSFFHLGGHSLLAARLVALIRNQWNVEISIRTLFTEQTIRGLANVIDASAASHVPKIVQQSSDEPMVISFDQQRLWLLDQIEQGSTQYNLCRGFELSGKLDIDALNHAFQSIVSRHHVLRTTFQTTVSGDARQTISEDFEVALPVVEIPGLSAEQQKQATLQHMQTETDKVFDLSRDLMLRVKLLKFSDDAHALLVTMHHIAVDGWSEGIIIKEFTALYQAYVDKQPNPLAELEIQYTDYAWWQNNWLKGDVLEHNYQFWRAQLKDIPEVHNLPLDHARPAVQNFAGQTHRQFISKELQQGLHELARKYDVTLFMVLNAAYAVLLGRYSNEDDIVVGTPVANRDQAELAPLVGFFVNTLVLRTDLSDNPTFDTLLQRSKDYLLGAYEHQQLPFERLVDELQLDRSLSYSPLVQVKLALQNNEVGKFELPELAINSIEQEQAVSKLDLSLDIFEIEETEEQGMLFVWEYATSLFDTATIEQLGQHFEVLLKGIVATPQATIGQLPILTAQESQVMLGSEHNLGEQSAENTCIHELIEVQAARSPNDIAVSFSAGRSAVEQTLTYAELNAAANQVAHYLLEQGVKPDTLVGICVERSLEMMIGQLGILKAGGAYVPIDPSYPQDRIEYILEDSKVEILLTESELLSELPLDDQQVLPLDEEMREALLGDYSEENIDKALHPSGTPLTAENLAYVIYTSGSTGKPKGVLIEHTGIVNLAQDMQSRFGYDKDTCILQYYSFAFDAGAEDWIGALTSGGTLRLISADDLLDLDTLTDVVNKSQVTHLHVPPSVLALLDPTVMPSIKTVEAGGEKYSQELVDKWGAHAQFFNVYGPTETSISSSFKQCHINDTVMSIGQAIPNVQYYVLDKHFAPCPVGVAGELFIAGAGLGRGYINQPELTAEKFITNPFADGASGRDRLYRTGDLVRWIPGTQTEHSCGELEFLGRIDQQVKIRGFRVELSEIESVLLQHEQLNEVAIIDRDTPKKLVAFFTLSGSEQAHPTQSAEQVIASLREYLKQSLPDYMVPSAFVRLDQLPLTSNGKVDRKALLDIDVSAQLVTQKYVAPTTEAENKLCEIWQALLKIEQVGITDNFFALGGDSILAIQAVNRATQAGFGLTTRQLFESQTIEKLAAEVNTQTNHDANSDIADADLLLQSDLAPQLREKIATWQAAYPLLTKVYATTGMQQGMLFHSSLDASAYVSQLSVTLTGQLNIGALKRALSSTIARHDVYRTVFTEDFTHQLVLSEAELPFEELDLSLLDNAEQTAQLDALVKQDKAQGFDVTHAPMMRIKLVKLSESKQCLVWSNHHALTDGWSLPLVFKEVMALYVEACEQMTASEDNDGKPLSSSLPTVQPYGCYISWLAQQNHAHARDWWKNTLSSAVGATHVDIEEQADPQNCGARKQTITLAPQAYTELQSVAKQHQVTMNTVVQAAWAYLLHRYSGEDQVIFGETISGRPAEIAGVEQMVGLFINSLPVLVNIDRNAPIGEWLRALNQNSVKRAEHGFLPLSEIQTLSPLSKLSERQRNLFDTLVVFENYPVDQEIEKVIADSQLQVADIQNDEQTNYGLTLTVLPENNGQQSQLSFELAYRAERYGDAAINRLLTYFGEILSTISGAQCQTLQDLTETVSYQDTLRLVKSSKVASEFPHNQCIHELFEAQVAAQPEATALIFDNVCLTYSALNQRANQLARHLVKQGVTPDSVVGVCVDRSPEMLVSVLAVMKAGGAYLPLDPAYPRARLAHMVADSGVRWVITQKSVAEKLTVDLFSGGLFSAELAQQQTSAIDQVFCIDDEAFATQLSTLDTANIATQELGLSANNLAYVIYTSGSTGKPKGVMLTHRNATNFLTSMQVKPGLTKQDKLLAVTSLSFDIHVLECYLPLITGAQVVIASSDDVGAPERLATVISEHNITTMQATPATWKMLLNNGWDPEQKFKALCGGEALSCALKDALLACQNIELWNMYGPTETAVWSATCKIEEHVSLGNAIANTHLYVLDKDKTPVPMGVAGELYIGGEGVARGYLNQPELTATRFVDDPFNDNRGARMYRTGDLVRWVSSDDGLSQQLSYIARADQQVKLRGYRIEPGEIETRLNYHPEIKESVVVARGDEGSKYLVAFYLAKSTTAEQRVELDTQALKSSLRLDLPEYMVPAAYISLSEVPLTANGKVNRQALESMDLNLTSEQSYQAPRNETETALVAIWGEVLDIEVEKIGVDDSFFELGGHSLLATQVISKIRSQFAIELPLKTLFEQETIAGLGAIILASEKSAAPTITTIDRETLNGTLPLSYVQERLWFIDQLDPDSAGYNIPGAVTIKSDAAQALDVQQVEQALNIIIARHENLRTLYPSVDGKVQQVILAQFNLTLASIDLSHIADRDMRLQEAQKLCQQEASTPFDLGKGPLIRGGLIKLSDVEHILVLNMHHIISDGWSMSVIIKEFRQIMAALEQGQKPELPALPVQYLDYSVWQRQYMEENGLLDKQLDYWREKLSGVPERLNLATDYPRPKAPNFDGATETFHIDAQLTEALNQLTEAHSATLYMTLQAAFKALLYRYTGQEDICFGGSIANRQHEETEGLIGMFANTLVYRDQVAGDASFAALLAQVKTTCLEAYAHQDTPFEKIVDLVQPDRTIGISPLFQVMFVLHNVAMELSDNDIQDFPLELNFSRFDLIVHFTETADGLDGMIVYKTALFKQQTIARLVEHFTALCRAIVSEPDADIAQLSYVSDAEQQALLIENNSNPLDYPKDKCIHQLFAEQAAMNPGKVAVTEVSESGTKALTFSELHAQSLALAGYLQLQGVKPDSLVGLCVERSLATMVGLLGILQAGGAYVPMDPSYPTERLTYMLEDSETQVVITQQQFKDKVQSLVGADVQVIVLDEQGGLPAEIIAQSTTQCLDEQVKPDNLAYVIYTSGSTGQPKGVMIEHGMVVDYCYSVVESMDLQRCDTFGAVSTFASDLGNIALYVPMLFSKTLTLFADDYVNNPIELHSYMQNHPIDCMKITPSHFEMFKVSDTQILKVEKVLIFAGEALTKPMVDLVNSLNPDCAVFNNYGPTETTISKISSDVLTAENTHNTTSIALGKPLHNTRVYILDSEGRPAPIGVPGELHIAGDGVARGYLNRPELTQEKFVVDPFAEQGRMYKTGDLARWLDNGDIEYLGRIDTQVKIRGFRIEVDEIESVLGQHEAVANSVVVVQSQENEDGLVNKQLIAFYVPNAPQSTLDSEELKAHLLQTLPEYMVPMAFVALDSVPLLANGKVDRQSLANMNINLASGQVYVAPRNKLDEKLISIWAGILQIEPDTIGINDDFFSLGGHSLLAVLLVSKVKKQLQVQLPLQALFNLKTISGTADYIMENTTLEQQADFLEQGVAEEDFVEGAI
ncbi:non-ribosomal peptide synthetase [Pseudoalteromonas luteoviolacea]|uniref:Carrier domain-containing protein n=1 Tax=Pseudoalteromonas luteoviolacea S4060-1 TaxID=1365257 RepID=A0A167MF46_9GAMM|nr:non-ribosomal peptide synthetase [Pseudoalteromonas luteoviolacea]KZN66281.1 hypothetical protein N478_20410 [Pseudoalteromonas luteoviolacea S4060-1]